MLLPYANLQVKHWNPGATAPLVLPVHVICNTSDEDLHRNISINSRRPGKWVKQEAEHSGVAVMCGSGPSLADSIAEIRERISAGGTLFAMNAAASYLHDRDLMPDYQVLIDPRPETAPLVGPAREHLIASQCHPDCFKRAPKAKVWHLQIQDIDDLLPIYDEPFTLVGGAASVGNTALCLAYALGFRTFHLYGYDSSNKGEESHAFHQPLNDGDPTASVLFNGKTYRCSITMKLQAERFQDTARALVEAGCSLNVHGYGLLPDMWNTPVEQLSERDKYERLWTFPLYRIQSPGEEAVEAFLELVRPDGLVIDFGCGTGRAALKIHETGCEVVLVDFASNCRDPQAGFLPFFELDLSEPMPFLAPFGFCADVLEHIPPEKIEAVISNIMAVAKTVFFQISTREDSAGAIINQKLHLIVEAHEWWENLFSRLGFDVKFSSKSEYDSQFIIIRKQSGKEVVF